MANSSETLFTTQDTEAETHASVAHHEGGEHAIEPTAFGLEAYQWVSVAMLVLLLIAFLGGKVHKSIGGGLDSRIASIREQLDEAKKLRAEAEALRQEYADKIAGAEKDAAAMLDHARTEASAIVERAQADTEATIARRQQMAEDKIAAAERGAVEDLRAEAASAAALAARGLIAENYKADADRQKVDEAIAGL
ncbi:hypothetical protein D6851_12300 [Altericroceibacterium spongiae]|uniref:ATP synthase subunit b n=1 Tax=Altericroceibacterium spongiae TaxID=2320269 RepID=A0A420EEZ6_9SPHN|nr:hypothetical protein [Altericroceibacterium spongiae]RKF19243.1 hypothetical protein D6851_12300 [Altericroceibacterium spongiae]